LGDEGRLKETRRAVWCVVLWRVGIWGFGFGWWARTKREFDGSGLGETGRREWRVDPGRLR